MAEKSSYIVALAGERDGQRISGNIVLQLNGSSDILSGASRDSERIGDIIRANYPRATEYLPMQIPNRQFLRTKFVSFWNNLIDGIPDMVRLIDDSTK